MKNNLKALLYLPLVLLTIAGCKKKDPAPPDPVFSVTSTSFPEGVIASRPMPLAGGMESPQLTIKAVPSETAQLLIVLQDDARYTYWCAIVSPNATELNQTQCGTPPQYHNSDMVRLIKSFEPPRERIKDAKECALLGFALKTPLDEAEILAIKKVAHGPRAQKKDIFEIYKLLTKKDDKRILEESTTKYALKEHTPR